MAYVIGGPCVDIKDMSCIEECPVDCIYEGGRKLYIQPKECIDCGACEPVCPVEAIFQERRKPVDGPDFVVDNRAFFEEVLPGRDAALGAPGGSLKTGTIGEDSALVRSLPPNPDADSA